MCIDCFPIYFPDFIIDIESPEGWYIAIQPSLTHQILRKMLIISQEYDKCFVLFDSLAFEFI